jgi:hypothetical protein
MPQALRSARAPGAAPSCSTEPAVAFDDRPRPRQERILRRVADGVELELDGSGENDHAARPRPITNYVEQTTMRMFACPRGHSAVIYDLLAFCPWCGTDTPPRAVFAESLAAQPRLLALIEDQPAEARADIEARGGVTALAERALTGAVAAGQNLAKQLHGQRDKPVVKGNPWQNVDRLAKQWRQSFRADLLDGLDDATMRTLRLAFARRHVLEHNGGAIDVDYVSQTGEGVLGRRIRVRLNFVERGTRRH